MKTTSTIAALIILLAVAVAGCQGEQRDAAADLCAEHQVAAARCPFCNPDLIASMGLCPGHGVPEALCYQCTPALVAAFKAVGDWCGGHDRPESQCYICNPELAPGQPAADQASAGVPVGDDDLPRRQRAPTPGCSTETSIVRLAGPEIVRAAGLEFATVSRQTLRRTLNCNAVVAYDGNHLARLSSLVPGTIAAVHGDLGQRVAAGDPLVTVTSAQLGAAKAAYRQAQASVQLQERNHQRTADLMNHGATSKRNLLEAETHLAESRIEEARARQELLGLGFDETRLAAVAGGHDTGAGLVVTAPFAGVVIGRDAVVGEVVDPSRTLMSVADVSRMWIDLDVREADIAAIAPGQPVELRVDGLRGLVFTGAVTWVGNEVDPRTRLLRARAEAPNPDGLLRANMFARAEIMVGDDRPVVVVPAAAVQWDGCCNLVFVRQTETVFAPRKVRLGPAVGGVHEVLAGLDGGEEIVTVGSFLLKTEILKGNLGAGCCEAQPGS